jgi:hypothetical protein
MQNQQVSNPSFFITIFPWVTTDLFLKKNPSEFDGIYPVSVHHSSYMDIKIAWKHMHAPILSARTRIYIVTAGQDDDREHDDDAVPAGARSFRQMNASPQI